MPDDSRERRKTRRTPHYPKRLNKSQEVYDRSVRMRWFLFRPLVVVLARLGVSANAVSYASVLAMLPVVFVAHDHPWLAVACMAGSVVLDMNDGLVARHRGTASDKGKFVDMVCDNVSFTVFMLGVTRAGLMAPVPSVLLTYTMILSKVLRSVTHAYYLDTDWFFRAVAGFLPNFAVACTYGLFLWFAATGENLLSEAAWGLGGLLALDSVLFFVRIQRDLPGPRS